MYNINIRELYIMNKIYQFFIFSIYMIGLISCSDESSDNNNNSNNNDEIGCTLSERKCSKDKKSFMMCIKYNNITSWSEDIPCEDDTVCNDGVCIPKEKLCTATSPECTSNNKGYHICVNGVWSEDIPCEGTETCKAGKCTGEDITSHLPCENVGEQRCLSNTRVQVCDKDNYWKFTNCPEDIPYCDSEKNECTVAECHEGDVECDDTKTLATCVNYKWQYDTCPADKPLCKDKKCQAAPKECTHNDFKCDSNTSAALCDENGYWSYSTCTGDEFCHKGKCVLCKDGETKCSNNYRTLLTCVGGTWESSECSSGLYCPINSKTCEYLTIQEGVNAGKTELCKDGFSKCASNKDMYFCQTNGNIARTTCWDGCDYALDGIGASCRDNDLLPCTIENAISTTVDFYNSWVFYIPCSVCKKTTNGDLRWIPVDNSYCQGI